MALWRKIKYKENENSHKENTELIDQRKFLI